MTDTPAPPAVAGWAILEIMGHRQTAGLVTECQVAGKGMLRVDTPAEDGTIAATQFYSPESLFCVTPCDEAAGRRFLARCYSLPEPVRLSLPGRRDAVIDADDDTFDEEETL